MKIGFGFYGIADGTDAKTGYTRDFRDCWDNIQENLINPFVEAGHTSKIYASTYPFQQADAERDFWNKVNPEKVIFNRMQGSNAFTAKSALHNAFDGEDLDIVVFTRFDILFHQKMNVFPIKYDGVNLLFREDPVWWDSHRFVCDCFYIWNHQYSGVMLSLIHI